MALGLGCKEGIWPLCRIRELLTGWLEGRGCLGVAVALPRKEEASPHREKKRLLPTNLPGPVVITPGRKLKI